MWLFEIAANRMYGKGFALRSNLQLAQVIGVAIESDDGKSLAREVDCVAPAPTRQIDDRPESARFTNQ